jgi:hypothetical protein
MLKLRKILLTLLSAALLGSFAGAGQALASHTQTTYFEGSAELLDPLTRPHAIEQMRHLGVHALRVELPWAEVTQGPDNATEPNFEAANPASYDWGEYSALIAEANRLRWPVLLTVTAPAPRWATANRQAPYITRPDPQDFKEFMTAVGREYAGKVSLFAIWNEPNHPAYLLPQWNSNGTPASPRIYRALYQFGYEGLQAAGIAHPRVLFGETEATGYDKVNVRREGSKALQHDVAPLLFLRDALCLNAKYKKSGSCSELQMTGFSHHAYSKPVGPYYVPPEPDNVTIGVLSRLSHALDLAAHAHAIPAGLPIYLTEFGVQSYPSELGVSPAKQVEYDAISEHIAYSNPRVVAFSQYLLKDDATGGAAGSSARGGFIGFQSGLEYFNGTPKPLYAAWPIPLTVTKTRHGVALWGLVRPTTGSTKVTILIRAKGSKRARVLRSGVRTNSLGYWSLSSSTPAQYWRVQWKSPTGVKYEGPWILASKAG